MTIVIANNSPRVSYTVAEDATQTSFAVSFEFFADADLNFIVDGTTKTLTTHYTVSGGDGSTGTITTTAGNTVTGISGGSTVVITRDIALERVTDFPAQGSFQISSLNTELDRFTAIAADLNDKANRAIQATDYDTAVSVTLPLVADRKGTVLAFNASTGAVEAGPSTSDVQTVSANAASVALLGTSDAVADMNTLATAAIVEDMNLLGTAAVVADMDLLATSAVIEDMGLLATSAVIEDMGLLATSANVTAMGVLGTAAVVEDMGILSASDVVADMALLATTDVIADMALLATTDVIADMAILATSDIVADLAILATTDVVADMALLATTDIVSDLNTLATTAIVTDLNILATTDVVADLAILATTDIVADLAILATTDIVTDLNLLATSAIVDDLNLLATSTVIADMATLAGGGANPNITSVTASGEIAAASLDISGNIDVDGISNLDVVDIDGAVDMASTALVTGVLTANGGAVFNETGADVDFRVESDTVTHALFVDGENGNVVVGGATSALFNSTGGAATLTAIGSSSSTAIAGNTDASIAIVNTDTTANNTAGLHFARADTDDIPNYAGASIVAQFLDTQATSNYPRTQLAFLTSTTANTTPSEKMRITDTGNVGIGTTAPDTKLHIIGSVSGLTDGNIVHIESNNDGGNRGINIGQEGDGSQARLFLQGYHSQAVTNYWDILINPYGGKVGIGTTNPTVPLHVALATNTAAIFTTSVASQNADILKVIATGNATSANIKMSTTVSGAQAQIRLGGDDALVFANTSSDTERMRIDATGKIYIGTTTNANAGAMIVQQASNGTGITVNGVNNTSGAVFMYFTEAGANCGYIQRVGTTGAVTYATSSDYRLKENVQPMTGALAKVSLLKPVTYDWKAGGSSQGFVAHELQEVIPDAVTGVKDQVNEDGSINSQGIDTSYVVATLTAAMQEQQATIEALEARLTALEG